MSRRPKVFITSAGSAASLTLDLANELKAHDVDVSYDDYSLDVGRGFSAALFHAVKSTNYVILIITPDVSQRHWLREELEYTLATSFRQRDVIIIPVLIGGVRVPPVLAQRTRFQISNRRDPYREIKRLVDYIQCIDRINFQLIDPPAFEGLVYKLLHKIRFKEIDSSSYFDRGYDIKAITEHTDPFGGKIVHNWIFEIKHYRHERADIGALRQLSAYLADSPPGTQGVLINSGQLTSAAQEWIDHVRSPKRGALRIIDGPALLDLVARHTDLVDQFFGKGDIP